MGGKRCLKSMDATCNGAREHRDMLELLRHSSDHGHEPNYLSCKDGHKLLHSPKYSITRCEM